MLALNSVLTQKSEIILKD